MPLFSNKFRKNIAKLRQEKSDCIFTSKLLSYLEHPNITPLGFFIFLDNLNIKNLRSIKKISLEILCDLGFRALQHQATLQHSLEDLEKLGILLQVETTEYKQYLKQTKGCFYLKEDKLNIKMEIERVLKQVNYLL